MKIGCPHRSRLARMLTVAWCAAMLACAGCVAAPQDTPPPAPTPEPSEAPVEEAAAEEPVKPAAPAVSYQNNKDLVFDDIPAERVIDADALKALVDGDTKLRLIDIRSWAAYDKEHVAGATSIPAGQQIVLRIDEISKKITLVLVAQENERLAEVRQTLIDLGIPEENILVLDGGLDAWKAAGYPVQTALEGEVFRC